jgi:miniconductance mechanosensitive channel
MWDDIFLDRRLQNRLALLAPAVLAYVAGRLVEDSSDWNEALLRATTALLILVGTRCLSALLAAVNTVYETKQVSRDRPIEAYIQLGQILLYLVAAVSIVAVLLARSPFLLLTGLGAMTAVLLLIFKDTILSFVASIQLAQSDIVNVGDWIEMPEFGADGDVIDGELHTITVQNFDRTIVTIPTSKLISGSFRSWRGMAESGKRRIKRAVHIDLSTIRFLTDEEVERLARFRPLRDYMAHKLSELDEQGKRDERSRDDDRRRLTNIGTFRAYIVSYLRSLDTVDTEDATFLVRQLQPGPQGLPLEIYVFANTADWARYEAVQADIFDRVLAMVPFFGLLVFQEPTTDAIRSHEELSSAGDIDAASYPMRPR